MAATLIATGCLKVRQRLIRFVASKRAVLIGVEHLEHRVRALLGLGARLVALHHPAAIALLSEQRRRDHAGTKRNRDNQLLHGHEFLLLPVLVATAMALVNR